MGTQLAARLVDRHSVVIVERDFRLCEQVSHRIGAVTVEGSATAMDSLKEAGIRKADVAVGMMRGDADNLAFALLAKHYGVGQIAVRMRDQQFEEPYRLAGATLVVDAIDVVLAQIVMQIQFPQVRDAIPIGRRGEMSIFRVSIPAGAALDGMTVAEMDRQFGLSKKCTIVAAIDPSDMVTPARGDTVVQSGGEILFVTTPASLPDLIELVTRPASE